MKEKLIFSSNSRKYIYIICSFLIILLSFIFFKYFSSLGFYKKRILFIFVILFYVCASFLFFERNNIKKSYFIKKYRENRNILLLSVFLALLFTFISYPGIIYSDSYGRISMADNLKIWVKNCFSFEKTYSSSWLTYMPSIFIGISKKLTGTIALYTFFQSLLYFFASYLLIKKISVKFYKLKIIFFTINPIFFAVSVYYEAGIGCLIGLIFLFILLRIEIDWNNSFDKVLMILFIFVFSIITFGYRANAFTTLPILFFMVLIPKKNIVIKIIQSMSVILGFLSCISILPYFLGIKTMESKAAGFVWDIVKSIQIMHEEKKVQYLDLLDSEIGAGYIGQALEVNNDGNICAILWFDKFNVSNSVSIGDNGKSVIKKYFYLLKKEPKFVLKSKFDSISRTLGIKEKLGLWEWDYNRWDMMNEFQFNDSVQRMIFYKSYLTFGNKNIFLLRPILLFLLSLLLIIIYKIILLENILNIGEFHLFLIAIFYYGAFLINTQSMEVRYYYPSFHLMSVLCLSLVFKIADEIIAQLKLAYKKYFAKEQKL